MNCSRDSSYSYLSEFDICQINIHTDSVPLGAGARVAVQGACARDHTLYAKASRARAYTRMGEGGSGSVAMKQSSRDNTTGPVHFVQSIVPGHFGTKLTRDK